MTSPDTATSADPRGPLRAALRARRQTLSPVDRLRTAEAIARHLQPRLQGIDGFIAGYWAVGGEVLLHAVQNSLPETLGWCLPVLHEGGSLRFARWNAGEALVPNRFGIPEPHVPAQALVLPEALSVVLLPLLAFDGHGNRLGMGGGWYDRSFAFRRQRTGRPRLIGVGYEWQRQPALPAQDWDVPLDVVVTEAGFQEFR